MGVENNNIKDNILKAIDIIAQRRIEQLELDKTIIGIINSDSSVTADGKKVYRIKYEGGFFNAIAQNSDDRYLKNTSVYIQVPKGDFSNDKFILGRTSDSWNKEQASVVTATANNYSIIGNNIFSGNVSDSFGVKSYHDPQEENEEDNKDSIYHRYYPIYLYEKEDNKISINTSAINLYKEEASAIMLKADFLTKLSSEQRKAAKGEYGLIFTLAFKNLAGEEFKTYGETLTSFAEVVQEQIQESGQTETLLDIIDDIQNLLYSNNENIFGKDKALDIQLNRLIELQRVFSTNHSSLYTDVIDKYFTLYINKITDLVKYNTLKNAQDEYDNWMNKETNSQEKILSYYISSNNMVGNPFILSSWTTQYEVFEIDLENFLRVDSIWLYKDGFIEDSYKEEQYLDGKPDILVKDLQFYMMKPLTDFNGTYQLKVEAPETGMIFENQESPNIKLKATLIREYFEDLSSSSNTIFYWFKQDNNVVSPSQEEYNVYAGAGWKEVESNHYDRLLIKEEDNKVYENYYRCVVVYMGEETPAILRYNFIIYNYSGEKYYLISDLGNDFAFDGGVPTLTICKEYLNEENGTKEIREIEESDYSFYWKIINSNGQEIILNEESSNDEEDISLIPTPLNRKKILKNVVYYNHDGEEVISSGENRYTITRVQYPMVNVASSESVTFEVGINYRRTSNSNFTVGKASLTLTNHKMVGLNSYRLVIENGDQVFQYDEYGNAPNSTKVKSPQSILPLKAKIFTPNNLEVTDTNFRTKWFFPTGESLILEGEDVWEVNPATAERNIFNGQKVDFKIAELYNYNAFDNQIICQVTFNSLKEDTQILEKRTTFNFVKVGDNGTNGTDMVAKIEPSSNNSLLIEQPLTLITYYNEENTLGGFLNTSSVYHDEEILIASNDLGKNAPLTVSLYQKNEKIEPSMYSNVRWNIAGNTSNANNRKGKYFTIGDEISWKEEENNSDEFFNQQILKAEVKYDRNSYYAFYSLPIIKYENRPPSLPKNRIGIKDKTYLKDVLYNADGRNPLYSHNQGLELINLPENYIIEWEAKGGYRINEENDNKIAKEEEPCFFLLLEKDNEKDKAIAYTTSREGIDINGNNCIISNKIYILPKDEYSGNITNNYIQAKVYEKINTDEVAEINLIATVYAPINMTLNTYGLASLNAWDGNTINIDNDNGYIMAPQMGAGIKENDNLFTGVVMGKADDYSSGGSNQYIGLMGYKQGIRSFFLDAQNGNAYFGTPNITEGNSNGKIKKAEQNNQGIYEIKEVEDDYGEGLIELIPGEISKIGGWRLGRRSLFYITDDNENLVDIGNAYNDNWARKSKHEKDIGVNNKGILLNAAPLPYISIKGKPLIVKNENNEDENKNYDIDNTSGNAAIENGDSFELNLDPNQKDFFTIFRHFKNNNNESEREHVVGIDALGRFYTNSLKDKETSLNMNYVGAFGENSIDKKYVGLFVGYGVDTLVKNFIKKGAASSDTLYISGGIKSNEYQRPISIHGKEISLYTSNGSINTKTDSYIKIDQNNISAQLGTGNNNLISFNRSSGNSISLLYPLTITLDNNDFNLTTGAQIINSTSIGITNTGIYTLTNTGLIDIKTNNSSNIKLTRNSGSNIEIQEEKIYARVKNNENNMLLITSNTGQTTQLKSNAPINIASQRELVLTGIRADMAGGNSDSTSAIVLSSGKSKLRLKDYYSIGGSFPFYLDLNNAGSISVYFPNNSSSDPKQITSAYSEFQVGMNLKTSNGVIINGNYKGTPYGLEVDKAAKFNSTILSSGRITTNTGFTGNGSQVTYTVNTDSSFFKDTSDISLGSGDDSSWDNSILAISSIDNGRPTFATRKITVYQRSDDQIWNAISENVDSAISSALEDYAKKDDLDDYIKTDTKYSIRSSDYTPFVTSTSRYSVVESVNTDNDGKVTSVNHTDFATVSSTAQSIKIYLDKI